MSGDGPRVTQVRRADACHQVLTIESVGRRPAFRRTPCEARDGMPACPWRVDAEPGEYPAQAYRLSARTAYSQSMHRFGCHQSEPGAPVTCAGFLLRGAVDNIAVRLMQRAGADLSRVRSDVALHASYRAMAVANGVDPDDPALGPCRDDWYEWLPLSARDEA
ncbi:DUF6283 family protein [Streptomyces sp. NPDC101213]|uniref:DUF6283 family protein n=1 Tax=Streptomyces sp. NPDC101213 TaxID=3366130 RepID=UPI00381FC11C